MKTVLIALRRTLSDLAFIAALVALIALIALAPAAGAAAKYPPAGVCDLDGGEYAQLITSALVDAGSSCVRTRHSLSKALPAASWTAAWCC